MNLSLLEQTKCTKFLYSSEMKPMIPAMQAENKNLECFIVSSLDEMLQGRTEHYPYDETFAKAVQNPILVLHSSGSTGKATRSSNKHLAEKDRYREPQAHHHEPRDFCSL